MKQLIALLIYFNISFISSLLPPGAFSSKEEELSFTMNGQIPVEYFYVDDTDTGKKTHYKYSSKTLETMISKTAERLDTFRMHPLDSLLANAYQQYTKRDWVLIAALKYASEVQNSRVAVLGSSEPWIEALSFALTASSVVSIDYNFLSYGCDINNTRSIQTVSEEGFDDFYSSSENSFDVVFSISSVDHSGMGRYGDRLDGAADIFSIQNLSRIVRPGGLFFLTVPIGPDVIVFNLHRRYGEIRLPALLNGWNLVDRVAWVEDNLRKHGNWRQTYEPVLILRKPSTVIAEDIKNSDSDGHDSKSLEL